MEPVPAMRSRQDLLYRLLDRDYYESFDAYSPRRTDFYDQVLSALPLNWEIRRKGIWFYCSSPHTALPMQGWKIHISATPANAAEILSRVTSILFQRMDTDFKFALDISVVFLLNSKNWSRGRAGKFITIYPADNVRFVELLEELYLATRDMHGPYILSDHRYKDSNVVFYRYGGMRLYEVLNIKGERTPMLLAPDGSHFPDERRPYPVIPPWVSRVIPSEEPSDQSEDTLYLKLGQYRVESALSFSNAGGVYVAFDHNTNKRVVIKEARPFVNPSSNGYDAVKLLKKEYRLLRAVQPADIAPAPIDLFEEWEHCFLVEEFIEGVPLISHSAEHNILLRTRPTQDDFCQWQKTFLALCGNLFEVVESLHRRRIVFVDLSTSNVLVEASTGKLKLIDFESAYELDVDPPTALYTPGFVSQNRLAGYEAAMDDDYYAIGAVLMSYLFPVTGFLHLNPKAKVSMMTAIQRDTRLPAPITNLILQLMDPDVTLRPGRGTIAQVLTDCLKAAPEPPQAENLTRDFNPIVQGIIAHLNDVAAYTRHDRLFPTDQKLLVTNPTSLAWGAAGVGYALTISSGSAQDGVAKWILDHKISPDIYAPGLYAGMSGIAWSLLEMGRSEEAEQILRNTFNDKLLKHSADIFYGLAGWGLTCLRFFIATGNQIYLDQAKLAARHLAQTCKQGQHTCYWHESSGDIPLGFAHGASGVAVFLLYLYLATGLEEFLAMGRRSLEFDLQHAVTTKDGGLSWPSSIQNTSPLYPYWLYGSAGIGMSLLRYWRLLQDNRYWSILETIFIDVNRKYAVLPGRFMGLAGLGDFLLDMYEATGEARFLQSAHRTAEGIMQFQVERRGIAFPGDSISRLSCSYGNGSAGIADFLARLMGKRGSHYMLDCLFQNVKTGASNIPAKMTGFYFGP